MVLTSVSDETYRARAYALGAELFWLETSSSEEIHLLQDCIESLLSQHSNEGFRGMQSKSLVDIIQFECLSHSSSRLRNFHGGLEGSIWLEDGNIIDAQTRENFR